MDPLDRTEVQVDLLIAQMKVTQQVTLTALTTAAAALLEVAESGYVPGADPRAMARHALAAAESVVNQMKPLSDRQQ